MWSCPSGRQLPRRMTKQCPNKRAMGHSNLPHAVDWTIHDFPIWPAFPSGFDIPCPCPCLSLGVPLGRSLSSVLLCPSWFLCLLGTPQKRTVARQGCCTCRSTTAASRSRPGQRNSPESSPDQPPAVHHPIRRASAGFPPRFQKFRREHSKLRQCGEPGVVSHHGLSPDTCSQLLLSLIARSSEVRG